MFVAGDDAAKKPVVFTLAHDLGFDPVDAWPLVNARLLEPLAMLWIEFAVKRGGGLARLSRKAQRCGCGRSRPPRPPKPPLKPPYPPPRKGTKGTTGGGAVKTVGTSSP